jgi:cytochrome c biogenesis protein CcmG/thiol:disulfide interchange protein DsbE
MLRGLCCVAAALLVFLSACTFGQKPSGAAASSLKPESTRRAAPEFALKDAHGRTVRLSDYKGKVVLLNFWATWCGPCKFEIPWFVDLEQEYKDRGFSVLGISMDEEGWDVINPFTSEMRVNYRILLGTDQTAQLYGGVDSLPTTFLIDKDGKIASVHVGLVSKSEYQNEIEKLLAVAVSTRL